MRKFPYFRRSRPEDIPKKLAPEVLALAMKEARSLTYNHAVDITSLTKGEKAEMPRQASNTTLDNVVNNKESI